MAKVCLQCGREMCQALYLPRGIEGTPLKISAHRGSRVREAREDIGFKDVHKSRNAWAQR